MINIKCAEEPADLVDARHQVRRFARVEERDYHLYNAYCKQLCG